MIFSRLKINSIFFVYSCNLFSTLLVLVNRNQPIVKVVQLHTQWEQVIVAAKDQNRIAQHQLYEGFQGRLFAVVRQYIKDEHYAEDVLVTVFVKIFKEIANLENLSAFYSWAKRIAINESLSWLRSRKEMVFLEDHSFLEMGDNPIEQEWDVERIQFCIDKMPVGYKAVFSLYVIEGYKHQEIAQMLAISEGTSKSQLAHARAFLKKELANENKVDYVSN